MKIGEIVSGTVTGIKDYGAFVQIENYSGLIHISEFSDGFVKDIEHIVSIGDTISALIVDIDEENQKLKLSYKQANVLPSKLHAVVKIYKGFNALELKLNEWIEEMKKRMLKGD